MVTVLGIVAGVAITLAIAFILSKTTPRMANKVCRFIFLFVLLLPVAFGVNYVNVQIFGFHKRGLAETSIIVLLIAIWRAFLYSPQPHNSNTP